MPLATKLIVILLVLLGAGLVVVSVASTSLMSGYLVAQDDEQLLRQAQLVVSNIGGLSDSSNGTPTDYFLQIRNDEGKILSTPLVPRLRGGMISMPQLPADGTRIASSRLQVPFTVPGRLVKAGQGRGGGNPGRWRVVALGWESENSGRSGTLYIGLSLQDVDDIVSAFIQFFCIISLLIFMIAATVGWVMIARSLKPLRDIEQTASKIAAGDLSQRVPALPESTEVGSLSASLNIMLNRIEQSFNDEEETNAKMRRFVSDASHELRTPLAAISGYGELYEMQKATSEDPVALADALFSRVRGSTARMTRLVNDLLSLARLDEGRGQHIVEGVSLSRLLAGSCEDLHALDIHRPITLGRLNLLDEASYKPGAKIHDIAFEPGKFPEVTLACDPDQLRRVFTNIVGNIHRYTPAESPVEISLTTIRANLSIRDCAASPAEPKSWDVFVRSMREAFRLGSGTHYAVIRFADHGPGVRPEALSRIFDRFYTADPSRAREKGGTGLGMALALGVVKSQAGFIAATATPKGGLTQTLVLPVQTSVAEVLTSLHQTVGTSAALGSGHGMESDASGKAGQ